MAYFPARAETAAEYCRAQVRRCDVYLGVLGFGYGSPVPGGDGISYTEMEFREATAAGLPRLVFLLDPDAPIPRRLVDVDGRAVGAFRQRLRDAGLIVRMFSNVGDLYGAVLHALGEMRVRGPAQGSEHAPRAGRRPRMVPGRTGPEVDRPEFTRVLLDALQGVGSESAGPKPTVGLEGAGGFGKITLAAQVCRRPEVFARYPGGILWATIGERRDGADLAAEIGRLCEVLSGERPASADPLVAGARLGELLDQREPTLVVIDDVWSRSQLEPFLIGGSGCQRLVTARNVGVVPRDGVRLLVDRMNPDQPSRR